MKPYNPKKVNKCYYSSFEDNKLCEFLLTIENWKIGNEKHIEIRFAFVGALQLDNIRINL